MSGVEAVGDGVVELAAAAMSPHVPNTDGVIWVYADEHGEQPVTLQVAARAALAAALPALTAEVERLRAENDSTYNPFYNPYMRAVAERDAARAEVESARAVLAAVGELADNAIRGVIFPNELRAAIGDEPCKCSIHGKCDTHATREATQ